MLRLKPTRKVTEKDTTEETEEKVETEEKAESEEKVATEVATEKIERRKS